MDTHKNACLTLKNREEIVRAVVDCGLSKAEVARRNRAHRSAVQVAVRSPLYQVLLN
jgi:hypothetical protein